MIDLITHFGAGRARKYILVYVCIFSKWVAAFMLPNKHITMVAKVFHREITCQFGTPVAIWYDRVSEFAGDFVDYCARLGIKHWIILRQNPRANGIVE